MRDDGAVTASIFGVGALAGVIWLWARRSSAAGSPRTSSPEVPSGSTELTGLYSQTRSWLPVVRPLAAAYGIPVAFVLAWIQHESGGNPCAVGFPGEVDRNGQPLETGILQLMSPDDIRLADTTVTEMRANCSANIHFPGLTRHSPKAAICAARLAEEKPARPLTADEMNKHAAKSVGYLAAVARIVDASFARHGVSWPRTSIDYWTMVKAYHAGEAIPTEGLDASVKGLGHAPSSWADFKQGIENLLASGQRPLNLTRDRWLNAFANAEKTGRQAFGDKPVVGNARRYANTRGQYGAARI